MNLHSVRRDSPDLFDCKPDGFPRTQDLFENKSAVDDEKPVHPLERHKSRIQKRGRSRQRRNNKLFDDDMIAGQTLKSAIPQHETLKVDTSMKSPVSIDHEARTNFDWSTFAGISQQHPAAQLNVLSIDTSWDQPGINSPSLIQKSSMILEVGVFSAEGVLMPFEDLICGIKIGPADQAIAEPALCVPQEDHTAVEWNQT